MVGRKVGDAACKLMAGNSHNIIVTYYYASSSKHPLRVL